MDNINKRFLLFLLLCIPIRVHIVYFAKTLSPQYVFYLGLLMIIPALVMLYTYFSNTRQTGAETFGAPIWWNSIRPLHGLLLLCFSLMAINKHNNAYIPLALDVILGFTAFIVNHLIYH